MACSLSFSNEPRTPSFVKILTRWRAMAAISERIAASMLRERDGLPMALRASAPRAVVPGPRTVDAEGAKA